MAKKDILSTSEFLAQMRRTPLGSTTELTFGDAQVLSRSGIDISNYGNEGNEYVDNLAKEEKESTSFWENLFGTIDNIANAFGKGFVSMFEGIVDLGVTLAGDIGSWFGASTDWAEDFVKVDIAGNLANFTETFGNYTPWGLVRQIKNASEYGSEYWSDFGKAWSTLGLGLWGGISDQEYEDWREKYAYSHDILEKDTGWFGQAVLGVAEGAGQLVGMYLTAGIGGAAGLSAKGAQVLSLAAMSVGAAGKGTEQALEEGANLHQATLYGVLTGAVEAGTEALGGIGTDVASGIVGKAALKNAAVKKFTSTLGGKAVAGFLSEGLEEVLSDVANPLLKKISYDYDMDLGGEYASGEFWAGLTQSFVVGGVLGGVGEAGQYYKLGKTTINGKKVGQKGALAYSEFADAKEDLQKRAKKLNKTFAEIASMNEIDITEGTNIDKALEQVRTDSSLSEEQKAKLESALKKAKDANTKYMKAQDNLLGELQTQGITGDDLQAEYQNKVNEQAQQVGEELGIDVEVQEQLEGAVEDNAEIARALKEEVITSNYGENNSIRAIGDNSAAEVTALNSLEVLKTSDGELYADLMAIADQLVEIDDDFKYKVELNAKNYQIYNKLSVEEATKLAKQTVLGTRIANYFNKDNAGALKNPKNFRKILEIMQNSLTPINTEPDTVGITPEPMLPTETYNPLETMNSEMNALVRTIEEPGLKSKVRVGKSSVKSSATWLQNVGYQYETLAVKLWNSAASIEAGFRKFGDSQTKAMQRTENVRMARSIAADVSQNGFYEYDENAKIKRTTKGLYNGVDGIQDILNKEFAKDLRGKEANEARKYGFQTFYESLALMVEQDRINASIGTDLVSLEDIEKLANSQEKPRKTVFGRWLETRTMPADLLTKISQHFPKLSEAIDNGVVLDEATFNELAHKTATERSVELEGEALNVYKEASKFLRLLNNEDITNRLAQIDEEFPIFKEMREEVWKYNRELLKMQYEGGYLTKAAYEWMQKNYSHYVPTYREMILNVNADVSMSMTSNTMKAAKGSDLVIKDMFESMQLQTIKFHQKVALNELIRDFVQASTGELNEYVMSEEIKNVEAPRSTDSSMTYYLTRPALDGNVITYYENGEAHSFLTNENVMEGFQALAGVYRDTLINLPLMKYIAKAQKLVKNLLTTYNPFFGLRNAIRDLWDASFYSPTGMSSVLRNLLKAYKSIISNDIDYQTFVASGGIGTSVMTTTDIYTEKKKVSSKWEYIIKPWKAIERVNEVIEVATRYAQYLATTKSLFNERSKGKNSMSDKQIITRGVYEAHEITLNFSRSGTIGRQINNTFGLFLNANIQGFTKMARTFIAPKTVKDWAELILKCLILGIGTQLLNELIYFDDEDYKSLSTSIKNNYYLIKAGDQFIRIPKGRVISAFNAIVSGAFSSAKGDKKAMGDSVKYAVFDANSPITGQGINLGFFQALDDAKKNRTWYGGEIVSSKWDGTRPSEQYEKDTSYISRWIGKLTNTSPLTIEYILNQYTGIVGDILLPMTSDEASGYKLYRIVKDQYLIDPVEKSKYSRDFYDYKEQLTYDKTDGDAIATIQVAYMTKAQNEIKELNAKIKEIDEDNSKSAKEKADETKTIQIVINAAYKAAVENCQSIGDALKNYTIDEENMSVVQNEVFHEVLGAESALRIYNKNVYSKAQCYNKAGVSYENFYVWYFNMRNFSTKDEAERYIARIHVSPQIKNLIYRLAGWNLGQDKIEVLTRWLKNKGLTDEEIDLIL